MKRFEYTITKYSSDTFNLLVYFCSEAGECSLNQIPSDQTKVLEDILNKQGSQGWVLVQLFFGKDGAMAFWRRELTGKAEQPRNNRISDSLRITR